MLEGKLVLPGFAGRTKLAARVSEYECSVSVPGAGLQAWHAHTMQVPYLTAAVERYERIASYFGVEARHPLLDVKLMEFSASLPLKHKVRNGWTKYLLRLLARERLPDSVAWREGSESLSWSFTELQAEQFDKSPGFPHEHMEESLGSIVDQSLLEKLNPEYKWRYYLLYQWLKQSGQSVSK
jgi:asparagine synthetase B (glutamine-hydrolysing)